MATMAATVGSQFPLIIGPSTVQITTTTADVATLVVPCKCRILTIYGGVHAAGGSTIMTDLDLTVENGSTDINSTALAVVNSSAVTNTANTNPDSGQDDLAAGDVLHLDATVTGGSSPTADGAYAILWCVRE